jgi:hypothetical protein
MFHPAWLVEAGRLSAIGRPSPLARKLLHSSTEEPQMPEHENRAGDTSEYSSTKSPDTRKHAEERDEHHDARLIPGGPDGAEGDPGMSGVDPDAMPSEGKRDAQKGLPERE